jgi:hypothetical protein
VDRPEISASYSLSPGVQVGDGPVAVVELDHDRYGRRWLLCEGAPALLFTDNETNSEKLYGVTNKSRYTKDGINDFVVDGNRWAINPAGDGTKFSAHYEWELGSGQSVTVRLRFIDSSSRGEYSAKPSIGYSSTAAPKPTTTTAR